MSTNTQLVNAWILLDEDEPAGTNYNSSNSCYQTLIQNNIYQSVNILFICFVTTTPTSANTIPAGDGSSYTIKIRDIDQEGQVILHPYGLTNQDYMNYVIQDARKNNPNIKIAVTLDWTGDGKQLSNIFSNSKYTPQQNADNFAANLMAYLKHYGLDGFDIDWENKISEQTTQDQFKLLINAIGTQFKQQTDKHYYMTLSPAEVGHLDATAVNNNMDFVNLQLYFDSTLPDKFKRAEVNPGLFAYGAKFETNGNVTDPQAMGHQTAQQAYLDNKTNYHYSIFTCWRLNSDNYVFEQEQQQLLYKLVCCTPVPVFLFTAQNPVRYFYTTNLLGLPGSDWTAKGIAFYACGANYQASNSGQSMGPVYQYSASEPQRYSYGTSTILAPGWANDRTAFFAFGSQVPYTLPVYQYHTILQEYNDRWNLAYSLNQNDPNLAGWTNDGPAFYVPTNDRFNGRDNHYLAVGDALVSSQHKYKLLYQDDGDLVIYSLSDGKDIWKSCTNGKPAWRTYMQPDGNFVIYKSEGNPIRASNTSGHTDSVIIMQDDSNLVIYDSSGKPIWDRINRRLEPV